MRLYALHCLQASFIHLKNSYFVTTPIYYVNSSPHIGHLYSSVVADAAYRWRTLTGNAKNSKFKLSTGTDEHGTKIQHAARNSRVPVDAYCTQIANEYKALCSTFRIEYTDFIRTTDAAHKNAVQHFWRTIRDNGYIYSAKYSGWYCVSDETFLTDSQLKDAPSSSSGGVSLKVSAESGHAVEWTEEENYIFKLSQLSEDVKTWILKDNSIRPKKFQKILLDLLDEGVRDVSISRPISRVYWGITVPDDDSHTIYVWLDALVNYLTAAGYPHPSFTTFWPADLHVIGKDILKFHGLYWPAFLMAADIEPPRSILCHSHWTVDGVKMSKSKGNVVCPVERSKVYSTDGFRYFLLREGVAHSDGNYSETKAMRILNSELADTLGNLLNRCCGTILNPSQTFPSCAKDALDTVAGIDVSHKLMESVARLPEVCRQHYDEHNYYKVVDATIATLHCANLFFETLKPWELRKVDEQKAQLDVVLHITMETLRVCGVLLSPLVPHLAANLLNRINIEASARTWDSLAKLSWHDANFQSRRLSSSDAASVLFERIKDDRKK